MTHKRTNGTAGGMSGRASAGTRLPALSDGPSSPAAVGRHARWMQDLIEQQKEVDRAARTWAGRLGEGAAGRTGQLAIEMLRMLALRCAMQASWEREEPVKAEEIACLALIAQAYRRRRQAQARAGAQARLPMPPQAPRRRAGSRRRPSSPSAGPCRGKAPLTGCRRRLPGPLAACHDPASSRLVPLNPTESRFVPPYPTYPALSHLSHLSRRIPHIPVNPTYCPGESRVIPLCPTESRLSRLISFVPPYPTCPIPPNPTYPSESHILIPPNPESHLIPPNPALSHFVPPHPASSDFRVSRRGRTARRGGAGLTGAGGCP